jgi:hypothetical protein
MHLRKHCMVITVKLTVKHNKLRHKRCIDWFALVAFYLHHNIVVSMLTFTPYYTDTQDNVESYHRLHKT